MLEYVLIAAAAAAGALAWQAGLREAATLSLERAPLAVPGLPGELAGLRLLHLSDLHLRRRSRLVPLLRVVSDAHPDLVVITGDLIGGRGGIDRSASFLEAISAYPLYCCPGNADYVRDGGRRLDFDLWRRCGAQVLINQAQPLGRSPAWIAGVDDPHRRRDDLAAALAPVPAEAFLILLAHSPDTIFRPGAARPQLTLCGHTHGGQVCLPGGWPPYAHVRAGRRYASGVHPQGRGVLVVSRGVGTTRLPVRLFCPPQAVLWTLHPA